MIKYDESSWVYFSSEVDKYSKEDYELDAYIEKLENTITRQKKKIIDLELEVEKWKKKSLRS